MGSSEISSGWKGSSHLVAAGNDAVLLDCGEGASEGLFSNDLLLKFNSVFISHFHADHAAGLFTLVQVLYLKAKNGDPRQVAVYMPENGIDAFVQMFDLFAMPLSKQIDAGLELELLPVVAGETVNVGELQITPFPTDHFSARSSELGEKYKCFGFKLNHHSQNLVYSGDIGSIDCLSDQLRPGCTLLAEGMHVDWREIVAEANRHGVRRLIFTHFPSWVLPELKSCASECDFVTIAENGSRMTITRDVT